jgi:hypothetical protein
VPRIPVLSTTGAAPSQLAEYGFRSDDEGRFHIEGLPSGELTLTAHKPGFGSGKSTALSLRAGEALDDVVVTLPRGFALRGRVLDAQGHPAPHVRVDLASLDDAARSTTSDESGNFTFEAARGQCTLWARPFGQPAVKVSGLASELAQHDVVLGLERGTDRLIGRVLSSQGMPLEGASIRVTVVNAHGFSPSALSNADGSFEFSALPPPPYLLDFEHPEFLVIHGLAVAAAQSALVIRLERGTQLSGWISDAQSGRPVAAEVTFRSGGLSRVTRSGRDGSFDLQHLPYGAYEFSVRSERFLPDARSGRLDAAPGAGVPLRIALMPAASVSGEVVDALGRTVWNAQVAAGTPPAWDLATRTDHAGHFQLSNLTPGEHALSARHGEIVAPAAATARVVAGEDTPGAVLRLPQAVDDDDEAGRGTQLRTSGNRARMSAVGFAVRGGAVVVEHVAVGSAGERAGLQPGDVLLSVNGEAVRSSAQARGMLAPIPGQAVAFTLMVRRAGEVQQLRYQPPR